MRKLFHRQNTFKYMALAMAVMLSLSIASCSKDEPTPVTPPEMPTPNEPVKPEEKEETTTIITSSLSFPFEEIEALYDLQPSSKWEATVKWADQDWLSVAPEPGEKILIRVKENDSSQDRSGTITIKYESTIEKLTINQEGWKAQTGSAPQYVDLGFVNNEGKTVFWSTTNLGASSPCGAGSVYYYGETQPNKENKHLGSSIFRDLLPEEDPVAVKFGGNWRLPNEEDLRSLVDQCYWLWVTEYDGKNVPGYIVYKAKDNADRGKRPQSFNEAVPAPVATYSISDPHIFLPVTTATSWFDSDGAPIPAGNYMTSSFWGEEHLYGIAILQHDVRIAGHPILYYGFSVRPVYVE